METSVPLEVLKATVTADIVEATEIVWAEYLADIKAAAVAEEKTEEDTGFAKNVLTETSNNWKLGLVLFSRLTFF